MRWSIANEAYSAELAIIVSYYIPTEIYSLKRYDVNFHTQISSSQSEEQTIHFKSEKEKQKNKNKKKQRYVQSESRKMFFHEWEKWYVPSKATEACGFCAKIPAFFEARAACSALAL